VSTRLHLPHPHIAQRFATGFALSAAAGLFHHCAPVAHTDPAAVARWAEWQTPDQWLTEHGHREENR
jgi:hypothetical protein